jgi:hypothetical protein
MAVESGLWSGEERGQKPIVSEGLLSDAHVIAGKSGRAGASQAKPGGG